MEEFIPYDPIENEVINGENLVAGDHLLGEDGTYQVIGCSYIDGVQNLTMVKIKDVINE